MQICILFQHDTGACPSRTLLEVSRVENHPSCSKSGYPLRPFSGADPEVLWHPGLQGGCWLSIQAVHCLMLSSRVTGAGRSRHHVTHASEAGCWGEMSQQAELMTQKCLVLGWCTPKSGFSLEGEQAIDNRSTYGLSKTIDSVEVSRFKPTDSYLTGTSKISQESGINEFLCKNRFTIVCFFLVPF